MDGEILNYIGFNRLKGRETLKSVSGGGGKFVNEHNHLHRYLDYTLYILKIYIILHDRWIAQIAILKSR